MKLTKFSGEYVQHSIKHYLHRGLVLGMLFSVFVSLCLFSPPTALGAPTTVDTSTHPAATAHTVTWDRYSLQLDGKRLMVWSGEFHYWRLPSQSLWLDVLEKIKAAGFNTISIYFDWGYHSAKPGVYDFTGIRDVNALLTMTEQVGLYVIARPGPYINAETDAGGFPGWLITQQGRARSSAADYTAAYQDWLTHIDSILVPHQITHGGNIIVYQVENEYSSGTLDHTYMQQIEDKVHADGVNVPLDHNDASLRGDWAPGTGTGAVNLYAFDSYPQGFNCSNPTHWSGVPTQFESQARNVSPNTPIFIGEFQGGSFDPWGGPGYAKCQQLTGPDFTTVFYKTMLSEGVTMLNSYMTYGGTSWGWLPEPGVYSSYDYGAAIDEARQLTPKYYAMKLVGYMLQAVTPITATNLTAGATVTNSNINVQQRINPTVQTHFFFLRHNDATSTNNDTFQLTFSSPDGTFTVPQQSGTTLRLNGRDSKVLIANYNFGSQHLVYSTSEMLTQTTINNRDIAVLYGRDGEDGETVLHYATQPQVQVLSGSVTSTYANGNLRLNYVHHSGLTQVLIHGGTRDLLLLLGNNDVASHIWLDQTSAGPVLSSGPYLVRSADASSGVLNLHGDTDSTTNLTVFAPTTLGQVTWNGSPLALNTNEMTTLPGPGSVSLPTLTNWKFQAESPESQPGFNDASWTQANTSHLPMDFYGFHYGFVWYRGHFTAKGTETSITIDGEGGAHGMYSVWLNGTFLGSFSSGSHTISIPAGSLKANSSAVFSVLVENMGHDEDFHSTDTQKSPRGLVSTTLQGSTATMSWKIQGDKGGENGSDPVRGQFNTGGLFGERNGWYLPGFNTSTWKSVNLPDRWSASGVPAGIGWYNTTFNLNLPAKMDVPIGLHIADTSANSYQALIYVNGWLVGRYWNTVGPQTTFSLPAGVLNTNGNNTVAIAVWGLNAQSGGLGQVSLTAYGKYAQ